MSNTLLPGPFCDEDEEDILACTHCPDDEDDFEEDFWEVES